MFMPDQGRLFLGLVGDRWGLSCTCGRRREGSVHLFFNGKVHPVLVCVQDACQAKCACDVPCVSKTVMGVVRFSFFPGVVFLQSTSSISVYLRSIFSQIEIRDLWCLTITDFLAPCFVWPATQGCNMPVCVLKG